MWLYQSNRLETLFAQLHALLQDPLPDPLTPEIIVVQNQGMAQWVGLHLALASGIAAQLHFPLPARLVWDLLHRLAGQLPQEDLFRKPVLLWRIHGLLPEVRHLPGFDELATYLRDDPDGTKQWQLAVRISDLFDQYLIYRPDLLHRWAQEAPEEHWQAALWRRLTGGVTPLRARLDQEFRRLLQAPAFDPGLLPSRIHLFGLNALAPVYLDILRQISRHTEIHLFHLSPCRQYWGDLRSARQQATARRTHPSAPVSDETASFDQGHPLLASLGQAGQDFLQQLLEGEPQDIDLYEEDGRPQLLARLQDDILDLRDRTAPGEEPMHLAPGDRSVQFHDCASPLREIQVLHDHLLDLFTALPDLTPGDILVSAPDIQVYAEAVAGVFGEAAGERRIPWSIADQAFIREEPLTRCFLDLLTLCTGRFTAPEVLALCETEALLTRFDLSPASLPRLHTWVRETGIRWGLSAAHRQELCCLDDSAHSWQSGLDRLLLGHCMGECQEPCQGILPYAHLTGSDADELGGFLSLLATLGRWQLRLREARPVAAWGELLLELLHDFFAPDDDTTGLATLRTAIQTLVADCRLAGFDQPLPPAILRRQLMAALDQPAGGQAFLSGRVTFCNMVPMRSVPFRVICLLGMNDQAFPRTQHPAAFDLMAAAPRLGDRNRRQDDRYLFLEALLSAREVFYLSWLGRNLRDNSLAPPSVVVCELQDTINKVARTDSGAEPSAQLTTRHPMQPFSLRCFDGSPDTASYNPAWQPAENKEPPRPFLAAPLPEPGPEGRTVDLRRLLWFWRHPVRFFLGQRLGFPLREQEAGLEENEPFTLDPLELYLLRQETAHQLLHGQPPDQIRACLRTGGQLPPRGFGENLLTMITNESAQMAEELKPLLTDPQPPLELDVDLGAFRLTGWLTDLTPQGRVTWRGGILGGKDLIELWIAHLVLNLLAPTDLPLLSLHGSRDAVRSPQRVVFHHLRPVADPATHLQTLLALSWQGLSQPLPFFPATSLAWARAVHKGQDPGKAARAVWMGNDFQTGEGSDPAYAPFFSPAELPLSPLFIELAGCFAPILNHLEDGLATP